MFPLGPQSAYAPEKQPPPGGYVTVTNDPSLKLKIGRTTQVFCQYLPREAGADTVTAFTGSTGIMQYDVGVNGVCWLLASIQGVSRVGGSGAPLDQNQILDEGIRYSPLRARIHWNDGSAGQRSVDVDIAGGISIQVYARTVSVDLLYPGDDGYTFVPGTEQTRSITGVFGDNEIISARCAPVDSLGAYILSRTPQLTDYQQTNGAFTSRVFPVPAGATTCDISTQALSPGSADVAAISWLYADQFRRQPAGAVATTAPFLSDIKIPGGAQGLTVVSDKNGDQTFTVIWYINP